MPFFIIALVPQGMMLSQSFEQSENLLIICSPNGIYHISASELGLDSLAPDIHSDTEQQDTSCPYSTANNGFIDTSATPHIISVALVQAKPVAIYRSQYKLPPYSRGLPRAPPLAV